MNTAYAVIMISTFLFYVIMNQFARQKFSDELKILDVKEYPYRDFLAFGMWLYNKLNIPKSGSYHVFLYQRIVMVYGTRYAGYYLRIYWGEKFMYSFLGIIVACFVGAASGAGAKFVIAVPAAGTLLFFLADRNLDDRAEKRKLQLMIDFPAFVSKLALLMNAGMHLRQALVKIYDDSDKTKPLYEELGTVLADLEAGIGESQAWQEFSERCKVREITSFASMIVQNSKLGGKQMVNELKRMSHEAWEMRKNAARQLGETASAKLVFPMMLMLVAILIIALAPAIMQFSINY
ncbi:type II secretion system F domain protein [Thermoclostridium stercorarium subsp. stercorarium DSM 8532]|uniref:Type II secretion system F domain protein n=3 Tax=Thermoclostridium stercorarium TaxID=1510 RepID=L7VP23_THES1|nr:type II secretion system F family protein [Thermoclostridium stercorarium]AGC68429.1 type II secretion system F domain protein [Thermoclostridium stercorarium subsp. stercorarium DSM 8532]AGI39449.1 TadB [Thermoclostridium stercorarium subsp. stercorarium DSM 8532]ANW98801.1 type II secretion protein F [Thermoclostridium stercorarium subsp. thermolacticum DSM 2910]UZQ84428.1 type II secretion system F family protein [Thermoclostridium stercorarium]